MPPRPLPDGLELSELAPDSDSPRASVDSPRSTHREREPLIASPSTCSTPPHVHRCTSINRLLSRTKLRLSNPGNCHQPDEHDEFYDFSMEKASTSKARHFLDRIAVEAEPGLTNAQLMLTNHDLKPVEPGRRQWGAWNYVGFWVGMSFRQQYHVSHKVHELT